MKKALTRGLAVTLTAAMVLTIPAYAAESENYYVKVTNSDGTDPVYVELTDENSTATDTGRILNEDRKEDGKTYEAVTTTSEDVTVYEIGDEITDVKDMEVGTTYSFATGESAEGIETGDVLTEALDGGAVLTYTGDGTDHTPTSRSVVSVFRGDVSMVSYASENWDNLEESRKEYAAEAAEELGSATCGEDLLNAEIEKYLPSIQQDEGFENVTNADEYFAAEAAARWDSLKDEYATQEEAAAAIKAEYLSSYNSYYASLVSEANYVPRENPYPELAAEMNAVIDDGMTEEEMEAAILSYVGLTEEQYLAKKGAWNSSNSPVFANSGTVDVVKSGSGFDGCPDGVIFYDEDLGWSYACCYGGVDFGDATGMTLYNVNESVLDPDAFKVSAGEAIKLTAAGTAVAGANNVRVTCTLPNGEVSKILTYDFADADVSTNDCHVTVLLNGRYYTVSLKVLQDIIESEEPAVPEETDEGEAPVIVSEPEMTIVTLSGMINRGSFSGIVKDEVYADAAYHTDAQVENGILTVTADMTEGAEALRRLVLDEDVLSAMKEADVEKLVFIVGDYTFTITADQLAGLTDVVISIDPANGECTILVNGEDATADFDFTCEKS